MHRRTRLALIALAGIAVAGGLGWTAFRPVPVSVETATVTRAPLAVTVDVDGKTRIRDIYEVSAPIAGTALRSPVKAGDPVTGGQTVVARVRPGAPSLLDARSRGQAEAAVREAEAAQSVADSQLQRAEDDLAYAETQLKRTQALLDRGVATVTQVEDAAQKRASAQAVRDAAASNRIMSQGALERARAALIEPGMTPAGDAACCVELTAPITGRVLAVDQVSERPVAAGTRLLSIGDPKALEIYADPLSRDAVRIPAGAHASVERWGGPLPLQAVLRRIDPSAHTEVSALGIEEQRVDAEFDLITPPEDRPGLGDGYSVYLRIVIWQQDQVLQLPLSALFRQDGGWAVYRVVAGRARQVAVTIGQQNATDAQVLTGLAEGDVVITHPGDAVVEGALVEPAVAEAVK